MRERAYINLSGAALNSNKTAGFFKLNAAQYTSHFKHNRALSILPVHANFNSTKYKTKKPVLANNTYVSIEGFLESVETDSAGHACSFHVSVDNINFLGRATVSPSAPPITGITFHALSITVLISFLQRALPPRILPDSNSISTSRPRVHLLMPFQTLHPK